MDIQFYGANCVTISIPGIRAVVDDNLSELGSKSVARAGISSYLRGLHQL